MQTVILDQVHASSHKSEESNYKTLNRTSNSSSPAMCIQYQIRYSCRLQGCAYTSTAYSSHCDHAGRDGIAGNPARCPRLTDGGVRTVLYPCRQHRNLQGPNALQGIRSDAEGDRWRQVHARNTGSLARPSSRRDRESVASTREVRERWINNPSLYEREHPDMVMGQWSDEGWGRYFEDHVFAGRENAWSSGFAEQYWRDGQPWGEQRSGGRLMDGYERQEERNSLAEMQRIYDEMYNADGTLREELLHSHS